jgi:hypothetical protein
MFVINIAAIISSLYEGASKIFRTGAIYTAVVEARSTGRW